MSIENVLRLTVSISVSLSDKTETLLETFSLFCPPVSIVVSLSVKTETLFETEVT